MLVHNKFTIQFFYSLVSCRHFFYVKHSNINIANIIFFASASKDVDNQLNTNNDDSIITVVVSL